MSGPVSLEKIEELKARQQARQRGKGPGTAHQHERRLDVPEYLEHYGRPPFKIKGNGESGVYCLDACVFDESHKGGESAIVQTEDGTLIYRCFHDSCKDRTWKDAREKISGEDSLEPFMVGDRSEEGEAAGHRPSQATILVEIAQGLDLFHTKAQEVFAAFKFDRHRVTWNIETPEFKNYLAREFFKMEEKTPNTSAVKDALNVIKGIGLFDNRQEEVFIRVARAGDVVYLDLANEQWEAVKISGEGWEITQPDVYFRRPKGILPLPHPRSDGNIQDLRPFLNVDENGWRLTVSWLTMAGNPNGPYPILIVNGEQGSAKSMATKFIRSIIDPNVSPLRSPPRNEHDLVIAASNGWCLAYDNLSKLEDWLSDALCRIATGAGFACRKLYEDQQEVLFNASRPIILNGIDSLIHRMDLASRALLLSLPPIPQTKCLSENELRPKFQAVVPSVLGGLCTAISEALRNEKTFRLKKYPRMADFAHWVVAAEPALPWPKGGFMEVYDTNRSSVVELSISEDVVGEVLRSWANTRQRRDDWEGTASELLAELEKVADDKAQKSKSWPKSAHALTRRLNRLCNFLRAVGIDLVTNARTTKGSRAVIIKEIDAIEPGFDAIPGEFEAISDE